MLRYSLSAMLIVCSFGCDRFVREPTAKSQALPHITPIRGTGDIAPSTDLARFTFVVFGDNRPGKDEPQPETIKEIFAAIRAMEPRPAFALSLGDIVEGKDPQDTTDVIERQFADFIELAKHARVPIFNAPGNHEMDDDNDIPSERMHRLYQEFVAPSYGAFDYGNSHFICLNTENVPPPHAAHPQPPLEFSYMSNEQFRQLEADLAANKDKTHILIAMHYPLQPKEPRDSLNPTDRQRLADLLAKYQNISFVLAAHEHLYFNSQSTENVATAPSFKKGDATIHLISGGAGAPMFGKDKWSFHHYLIFEVNGEQINVTLKRLSSSGTKS